MTISQKIDNIETAIFDYEITYMINNIANVFSEIIESGIVDAKDSETLVKLNLLMSECVNAMQNKDYLLLADLFEFQLKPMIGG